MNKELIKITTNEKGQKLVSAKELYLGLGMDRKNWSKWYPRNIIENEFFIENNDWIKVVDSTTSSTGQIQVDFAISLEFAKHLAMQSRTQKSHEYRNYFIECEKQLQEITKKSQLLLDIYNGGQSAVLASKQLTEIEIQEATKPLIGKIDELTPQAIIGDKFTNDDNLYDMSRFTKILDIPSLGRNNMFKWLRNKNILRHNNEPYQQYMNYFKIIMLENKYNDEKTPKTLIKSKGVKFIVKNLIKDGYIITKTIDEILEELNKQ